MPNTHAKIGIAIIGMAIHGNKQVIDGLQRLSSIYSYINGEFRLRGLQYLTDFNGVLYHDLPKKYRTRIEETQLAVNTLDSRCHDLVKFDVFRRVNTGGVPLNSQEIRNIMSSPRTRRNCVCGLSRFTADTTRRRGS